MLRVAVLICVALTAVARADPPGLTPSAPPGYQWQLAPLPTVENLHWYRGQMVLADLAAFGVLVASEHASEPDQEASYAIPAGVTLALAGPIVHLAHGDRVGAAKSFALRVGLPLAGVAIAWIGFRCQGYDCYDGNNDSANEMLGGALGGVVAAVIDDGWLAHDPAPRPAGAAFTPMIAPAPGGGAVGMSGRF